MKDAFLVNGRNCWVSLEKTGLAWYLNDSEKVVYRVPACEIVSCWSCPRGLMRCCPTRGAKDDLISTPQKQSTSSNTESTGLTHAASDQTLQTVVLEDENPGASWNLDPPQHSNAPQMSQQNNTSNQSPCNAVEERNNVEFWPQPKQCRHSNRPGLSLEICERVLPSSCSSCVAGETNETMVTKWRPRVIVLHHDSHDTVCSWHEAIWKLVAGQASRPRRLLAIINPVSGSRTAEKLYRRHAAPLLARAAVCVVITKTTHCGHAEELAEDATRRGDVDGVVVVGGDGIVSEATAGLLKGAARECGLFFDDPGVRLVRPGITLGILAGGSTNSFVTSCNGTEDIVTHVLQIIMGNRRFVDAAVMHALGSMVHVSPSGVHAGYLGSVQETSVKLRHIGPVREVLAGIREFVRNRSYECQMRYLARADVRGPYEGEVCRADCATCSSPQPSADSEGTWRELNGKIYNATMTLASQQCRYSKHGVSPLCHLGDGNLDLIVAWKASRLATFKRYLQVALKKDHLLSNSAQAFRTTEVHFSSQSAPLNCDGELRYYPQFVFKVHRQCLGLYSRGREPLSSLELASLTNNF